MSNGTVKLSEGRYTDPRNTTEGNSGLFQTEYLTPDDVKEIGLPEETVEKINRAIERAVEQMHNTSCISQTMLEAVIYAHNDILNDESTVLRASTLTPTNLTQAIKNLSGSMVREIVLSLDNEQLTAGASQIPARIAITYPHRQSLNLRNPSLGVTEELDEKEVLNLEAQELLQLFGEDAADIVRDVARGAAELVLSCSNILPDDLRDDTANIISERQKGNLNRGAQYSTLSPEALVDLIKKYAPFFMHTLIARVKAAQVQRNLKSTEKKAA